MNDSTIIERLLAGLNEEQRRAVTFPHRGQLQIVAGPGTGKTKVLTARVAYLLVHHNIKPWQLIVTTFTRKAAKEMKDRLAELLEGTSIQYGKLFIGTFHSICIRLLRKYGSECGLDERFIVASNKDTTDILDSFLDEMKPELAKLRSIDENDKVVRDLMNDKDGYVVSKIKRQISHLKSHGLWPDDYQLQKGHSQELLMIYNEMHKRMNSMSMLDFDDILIYTVRLLQQHSSLTNVRHVLVDEFQDTNFIQMELLKLFTSQNTHTRDNLTVVGDVDQSIYAFRGANAKNFQTLKLLYPNCEMIQLKENYRSTQNVLDASECFMREQKDRIHKDLRSQHQQRLPIFHQSFNSDYKEAQYIAQEIKFLRSLPNLFKPKDIAILVRANYMTRVIEKELSTMGLPYSVLKGRAFWERKEVMAIVDLLKTIGRQNDRCAVVRSLVLQGDGIGSVTSKRITKAMEEDGVNPLEVLRSISKGELKIAGMTTKAKTSCINVVKLLDDAHELYNSQKNKKENTLELFEFLCQSDGIQAFIGESKEYQENLEEVKTLLELFTPEQLEFDFEVGDDIPQEIETLSFLEHFLNSIDIYSPEEVSEEESNKDPEDKVVISTIHSAKGLEWPVVFVVGINNGQFPSGRTDDIRSDKLESINEDRRVFYVSTTRAKHLLYLTSSMHQISEFLTPLKKEKKIESFQSAFKNKERIKELYILAGASEIPEASADKHIKHYEVLTKQRKLDLGRSTDDGYSGRVKGKGFQYANARPTLQFNEPIKPHIPQYAPRSSGSPVIKNPIPRLNERIPSHKSNPTSHVNRHITAVGSVKLSNPLKQEQTDKGPLIVSDVDTAKTSSVKPQRKTLGMKRRRF